MPAHDRHAVSWALIAVALLFACSHGAAAASASVAGAWIRLLPGDLPLAGYFTLRNEGAKVIRFIGAESPAFKRIELHRSVTADGIDKMIAVTSVTISADGELAFAPGGYHLMMWRSRKLEAGEEVPMRLKFADGNEIEATFVVKRPGQ